MEMTILIDFVLALLICLLLDACNFSTKKHGPGAADSGSDQHEPQIPNINIDRPISGSIKLPKPACDLKWMTKKAFSHGDEMTFMWTKNYKVNHGGVRRADIDLSHYIKETHEYEKPHSTDVSHAVTVECTEVEGCYQFKMTVPADLKRGGYAWDVVLHGLGGQTQKLCGFISILNDPVV